MGKTSFIKKLGDATERVILSRVKASNLYNEYYNRSEKAQWSRQSTTYRRKQIEDWTRAVMAATDPDNPRRGELMRFNQNLRLDTHLASVMDTRILKVQRSSFKIINEKGEENEQLKLLLERPWHDDLIRLTLIRNFQGTTLIELFDTDPDTSELLRVQEIPQSNFIPQKGIIIKEEYDDNGVSFREGTYKNYYVQIGNDWELGMFNELATIILAKKLGLGSWITFIEKLGIPPIFAITDRMDTPRRDELFDMLENFKSNHFAVLQGNERIEIPNSYNVDAYNSFKSLINDVCNTEISKRVLGGTGTVDEKSFVGSAEVHERVAQDRYEADKLLYKHYFNTQFRQRLAKISSVYADFATHTLVWDNQETLDITGYIDAIQKLSTAFDFDIDEIRNRTGLPITGAKTTTSTATTSHQDNNSQKKKPNAHLGPYAHFRPSIIYSATWDAAIERLANQIYNDEIEPHNLDKDLVLKNYAAFNTEAQRAFGKGYYENIMTRSFRENFLKFAGAKAYDLINKISSIKSAEISKEDFITQAKGLVSLHNETWLNTELRFCTTAVSSFRDYASFAADTDIYPNLKYRTMKDEDVRQSHADNEGIVKPYNEWTSIPPFDYGCRCWLEQTTDSPTDSRSMIGIKFNNNPASSGMIFNQEQSYFKNLNSSALRARVNDSAELMKRYMPYNRSIKSGESTVFINDFYDTQFSEDNINAAKLIAKELNINVYITSHVENSNKLHEKNPEYNLSDKRLIADLKTYNPDKKGGTISTRNFVRNSFLSANKQRCNTVVLDLTLSKESNYMEIAANKIRGEFMSSKKYIKNVIIIRGKKVITISKEQSRKSDFMKYFKF